MAFNSFWVFCNITILLSAEVGQVRQQILNKGFVMSEMKTNFLAFRFLQALFVWNSSLSDEEPEITFQAIWVEMEPHVAWYFHGRLRWFIDIHVHILLLVSQSAF